MLDALDGLGGNKLISGQSHRILVVGNTLDHSCRHKSVLETYGYTVIGAVDYSEAIEYLEGKEIDVVLVEQAVSTQICRKFLHYIRHDYHAPHLAVLVVIDEYDCIDLDENLESVTFDFIHKTYEPTELVFRIEKSVTKGSEAENLDNVDSVLFALARMVEAKDEGTGDHCSRLEFSAQVFGKSLGLDSKELNALRRGAVLHDIGKLAISDSILLKPGPLTESEWQLMRQHPKLGVQLCASLKSMRLALPIISYHHERLDGSGYPFGIGGEEIPLLARIFQTLDIYDALSNERPYKKPFSNDMIIQILNEEIEKGWRDKELTNEFINIVRNHPEDLVLPKDKAMDDGALIFQEILNSGVLSYSL